MKRSMLAVLAVAVAALVAVPVLGQGGGRGGRGEALAPAPVPPNAQTTAPELPFKVVPNFFQLPEGMNFGEVPGIAVDSKGNVYVFTRSNSSNGPAYGAAAAQLLEFTSAGKYMREIGKGLYAWSEAHTVRIDKEDNIWAIDKGSDMIIKFNQAGRVLMVFGRKQESADGAKPLEHPNPPLPAQESRFRQPTDVAWDSDGNTYITDGYVNSRVAKFDKHGDWVGQWGSFGNGPGQFRTPHTIVIDKDNNVYVGDRTNRRVQVFDTSGKFLRQFTVDITPVGDTKAVNGATPTGQALLNVIGQPNSLCIPPNSTNVLFMGESTYPARIFKLTLEGKVIGVIGRSGREFGKFSGGHQMACPSETEIYVAESSNWRADKILLQPTANGAAASR